MGERPDSQPETAVDIYAHVDEAEEQLRALGSVIPIGALLICAVIWFIITSAFDGQWRYILMEFGVGGLIFAGVGLGSALLGFGLAITVYVRRSRRLRHLREQADRELLARSPSPPQ